MSYQGHNLATALARNLLVTRTPWRSPRRYHDACQKSDVPAAKLRPRAFENCGKAAWCCCTGTTISSAGGGRLAWNARSISWAAVTYGLDAMSEH